MNNNHDNNDNRHNKNIEYDKKNKQSIAQAVPKSWPVDEQGRADGQWGEKEAGRCQSGWFKIMVVIEIKFTI